MTQSPSPYDEEQLVVLCADHRTPPPQLEPLTALTGSVRFADRGCLDAALPGARALLMWDVSDVLRDRWDDLAELRWVQVAAAGVDMILFDELVASGITLTNARGVFDLAIAEFVAAAVLAFAKESRQSAELQAQQRWRPRQVAPVAGSTALIVGTGSIGRAIARLLRNLGMEVRGAGRTGRDNDADFGRVVDSSDLAAEVGWADHVVVAAPLTEGTRNLIDASVLGAMRPSAHLINVGRGPIVNEGDLVAALRAGSLGGATLDVFHTEPLPPDHALWTAPGVTITPHQAGDTHGFEDAMGHLFLDNAGRWLRHQPLLNVVNKQGGFVDQAATRPSIRSEQA